ncbi:MAG: hypothetical protein M2R46_02947 [Verrucomicrobia subdivision 3 bacterium]|nr:hypothetical protein [Limisphaerales bacterium]
MNATFNDTEPAVGSGFRPRKKIRSSPTRQSVACFGAVSLRSGKFVHTLSPVFNAATFEAFLRVLLRRRSRNQKMVVILGQRTLPPRQAARTTVESPPKASRPVVSAALQPTARADQESLETDAAAGASQSLLQQPGGVVGRCGGLLRPMAKTEPCSATIMRHYLSRYV